ncbi:GtrA family protein [Bradyrhizobium centrosematis]|uniref:GtrA family protein n=1 Tax=Bradyrhizobium centrosematis TaxID=1300039 RepID=UPI0038901B3F
MLNVLGKLSRYLITGGCAAVVDLGGFLLLKNFGLEIGTAAIASFGVAALTNYALSARFVFSQKATVGGFFKFLLASLSGLAINVGITIAVVAITSWPPVVAKIIGISVAFGANFALNLLVVFRRDTAQSSYVPKI